MKPELEGAMAEPEHRVRAQAFARDLGNYIESLNQIKPTDAFPIACYILLGETGEGEVWVTWAQDEDEEETIREAVQAYIDEADCASATQTKVKVMIGNFGGLKGEIEKKVAELLSGEAVEVIKTEANMYEAADPYTLAITTKAVEAYVDQAFGPDDPTVRGDGTILFRELRFY